MSEEERAVHVQGSARGTRKSKRIPGLPEKSLARHHRGNALPSLATVSDAAMISNRQSSSSHVYDSHEPAADILTAAFLQQTQHSNSKLASINVSSPPPLMIDEEDIIRGRPGDSNHSLGGHGTSEVAVRRGSRLPHEPSSVFHEQRKRSIDVAAAAVPESQVRNFVYVQEGGAFTRKTREQLVEGRSIPSIVDASELSSESLIRLHWYFLSLLALAGHAAQGLVAGFAIFHTRVVFASGADMLDFAAAYGSYAGASAQMYMTLGTAALVGALFRLDQLRQRHDAGAVSRRTTVLVGVILLTLAFVLTLIAVKWDDQLDISGSLIASLSAYQAITTIRMICTLTAFLCLLVSVAPDLRGAAAQSFVIESTA